MTNDDAGKKIGRKRITLAMLTALLGLGLAGCETSNSLFGQAEDPSASAAAQAVVPPAPAYRAKVTIAPVIGAPQDVANQMSAQLASALEARQIAVAKQPGEASDYTLRGYVVAAKERTNTKISFIWDVNDPSGKRVNRVTGEEAVPSGTARDAWAAVTPALVQTIADRTATSVVAQLPATPSPVAVASATPAAAGVGAQQATPVQRTSATTTASISQPGAGSIMAVVPSVTGAPGDGPQSLSSALQRELSRNGVQLASAATATTYRVEGKVQVGPGKEGKQPIQIDWLVKDPRGNKLGTVSQKNDIPQGSLDGAWGGTADAAAAAAAQGILKLLPQTQTN